MHLCFSYYICDNFTKNLLLATYWYEAELKSKNNNENFTVISWKYQPCDLMTLILGIHYSSDILTMQQKFGPPFKYFFDITWVQIFAAFSDYLNFNCRKFSSTSTSVSHLPGGACWCWTIGLGVIAGGSLKADKKAIFWLMVSRSEAWCRIKSLWLQNGGGGGVGKEELKFWRSSWPSWLAPRCTPPPGTRPPWWPPPTWTLSWPSWLTPRCTIPPPGGSRPPGGCSTPPTSPPWSLE